MKRFSILGLICFLVFVGTSNAAVLERDWKNPGDGLITYDDVNQREWLDLTETLLTKFPGSDIESHFASVASEINPGGLFEGFSIPAINTEIVALAESAGIDTTTLAPASVNLQATLALIDLLGVTAPPVPTGHIRTVGYYEEFMASPRLPLGRAAGSFFHSPQSGRDGSSGLRIGTLDSSDGVYSRSSSGVFLYRSVIPEPSTLTFLSVGVALLLTSCRSATRQVSTDL